MFYQSFFVIVDATVSVGVVVFEATTAVVAVVHFVVYIIVVAIDLLSDVLILIDVIHFSVIFSNVYLLSLFFVLALVFLSFNYFLPLSLSSFSFSLTD